MRANSAVSRAAGIRDEELAALRRASPGSLFSERETAALAYADAITTSNEVDAESFEQVRRHFSETEIIELTSYHHLGNLRAKFNRALEIE